MKKLATLLTSHMFLFFALIGVQAVFLIMVAYRVDESSRWIQGMIQLGSILLALYVTQLPENPAYKIGWLFAILSFPVLGMCMYFFFRQRKLSRKERRREGDLIRAVRPYLVQDPHTMEALEEAGGPGPRMSRYIYRASGYPVYEHTKSTYYSMGQDFFEALLEDLRSARKYIFMEYFIVEEGVMLNTVLEILERKVREGVDVRFMYDDIGCGTKLPGGFAERLRSMGIQCAVFNPVRPTLNSRFNNRDHRKTTVIDGRVAYCSGANLADEYINAIERFGVWKDEAVRLEGAAAWSFVVLFLGTWCFTNSMPAEFAQYAPDRFSFPEVPSDGFVQPFGTNPLDDGHLGQRLYIELITQAEKYVYINTPYLDVGDAMLTALETAALSGVDVRITVPHIPDKKLVFMLTQSFYPRLIRAGVKIYEYTPGFIHSKTFVCDDLYGIIGTINMDFRSLYLHWEEGVWLYKTESIAQLKEDYLKTCEISEQIPYAKTQESPLPVRFFRSVLSVFGPLL